MAPATSSISLAMQCSGRAAVRPTDHGGDRIMTTFCEVVTAADNAANLRRARPGTTRMGEAMAPAPETPPSGGNRSGAGAALIGRPGCVAALIAIALCGCGDDARPPAPPAAIAAPDRNAADPARGVTTELDGAAPALRAAAFAELTGYIAAARTGFEQ